MKAALEGLGFQVDLVTNGSRVKMEEAVTRLKNRLSVSKNAYGFFFYAGHGVQSQGENYLLPVDADIPGEAYLRDRAVNVQVVLDELNNAGNELNVIVLDACRDNPFGWSRSGTRGLTVVGSQPAGSIIVYATSAGATASDNGQERNGLFTTHLLNNLKNPGLEVSEIFRRTGSDVRRASNNGQTPAIYSQFFETAYLGNAPIPAAPIQSVALPQRISQGSGTLVVVPNSNQIVIYNDLEFYELGASASDLQNITKDFSTGYWTIDNGYEEKIVSLRQDVTTNVTLKSSPDYGEPVGLPVIIDTKNKTNPPAWVVPYVMGGRNGIESMPQYNGRLCFVATGQSFHLQNENYLRHFIWQQIMSSVYGSITENSENIDSVETLSRSSIGGGFLYTYTIVKQSSGSENQFSYENFSEIIDNRIFEDFLNRLNYRTEEFWWNKTSQKFKKGSKEIYHSYLFVTVSELEFSRAIIMTIQDIIDNNPAISATERAIYADIINAIRVNGVRK
jgi:hypothetical protein